MVAMHPTSESSGRWNPERTNREVAPGATEAGALGDPSRLAADLVTATAHAHGLAREDVSRIKSIVEWRILPPIDSVGRSAWIPLRTPVTVECNQTSVTLGSLKIKGVGLRDHRGAIHHPSPAPYRRSVQHFALRETGEMYQTTGAPSPLGAITLPRAVAEFVAAGELSRCGGAISSVPLLLYRYPGLPPFRDPSGATSELAVLVAGLPTDFPHRGDRLLSYGAQSEATQTVIRRWAEAGLGLQSFDWLTAISKMWGSYGSALCEFHSLGFYRHNANPTNLGLGQHGVFFVDLDSTRMLIECASRVRALQAMRDVVGGLFHIGSSILASRLPEHFALEELLDARLSYTFLSSYFPAAPQGLLREAARASDSVFTAMWDRQSALGFGEAMFAADREVDDFHDFMATRDRVRTRAIDRPALFAELLPAVVALYQYASYSGQHLPPPSVDAVEKAATSFLRFRNELM
jgi:hypothetical protein